MFETRIALQLTIGADFATLPEVFGMFVLGASLLIEGVDDSDGQCRNRDMTTRQRFLQ